MAKKANFLKLDSGNGTLVQDMEFKLSEANLTGIPVVGLFGP